MDVPAGVTQEEGNTGFLIHLPSAMLAFIFLARRIQPFLSLVNHEIFGTDNILEYKKQKTGIGEQLYIVQP